MHDCPWFKLYTVDVVMAMDGMDDAARGRYFTGMLRAWVTNNYEGYPFLASQASVNLELRKKKSAAGKLGAEASNNLRKLSTSYPHSKGEDCIPATTTTSSTAQQTPSSAQHVPPPVEQLPLPAKHNPSHVQQKPASSVTCSAKTDTLSIYLSFFLSFFQKRREECREGKGLSAQKDQGCKYTLLDYFRSLPEGTVPFAEDSVVVASELVEKAVDPLAEAITRLRAGQQVITDSDLANWLEDAQLCIDERPEDRDADKLEQLIAEIFAIPPSTGNGFSWAQHIHSMADIRRLWSQGKIYIGMASKTAIKKAARSSAQSTADVVSHEKKSLTPVLTESSYKGTIDQALAEYLTDINREPSEKNITDLLTSETKTNLFKLWLTENFIRPTQQEPEIRAILATKFTDTVAITRLITQIGSTTPSIIRSILESLSPSSSETELESALVEKLYFP